MNWSEAKILFKYCSRSRPTKFFEGLDSIVTNLNQPKNCVVVCSFDTDDQTMNADWVKEKLETYPVTLVIHRGESKSKIAAVNRDLKHLYDSDIIICMSDDMRFIQKGFDDILRADFALHFPDGDGFLHYPDQHQGSACATMNITDAIYFNRFGHIYNPAYESVECDLENQEVAQMLGRYKYIERRIFNHLHPSFGDTQYDEQYNRTESSVVHERDKATRRQRKANNYDLILNGDKWDTPPNPISAFLKQQPMSDKPEITIEDVLIKHHDNILKSMKLRDKLNKKIEDCKTLAKEISELGILKVEVSVMEESLK